MAKTLLLQGIMCQNQMWPCFSRGSTYQNFESRDNFALVLVSEDHEISFKKKFNLWFVFEWMHVWMHENLWFAFALNAYMSAWYNFFRCLSGLTFPLGNECMTLCWCMKFRLTWDFLLLMPEDFDLLFCSSF